MIAETSIRNAGHKAFSPRGLLIAATLVFAASAADAAIVTYEWAPAPGQGGLGSMTFDSPLIVDAANFSGVPLAALSALNYTWTANGFSITKADVQTFQLFSGSFSAAGGFLTSQFLFSTNIAFPTPVQFGLSGVQSPGLSSNNLGSPGPAEINAGQWKLAAAPAAVPLPPAAALLLGGLGAFGLLRRKRKAAC